MITNKKWQELLALAKTGKPCPKDATEEERDAYKGCLRSYQWMLEDAKKRGIKNPVLEIPFDLD